MICPRCKMMMDENISLWICSVCGFEKRKR